MLQCQLWALSHHSLPFINIYNSSSTKNNILELREQEKKKKRKINVNGTWRSHVPQDPRTGCMSSTQAVRPLAASPSLAHRSGLLPH